MEKNYLVKHLQQNIGFSEFHYCFQWCLTIFLFLIYILTKAKTMSQIKEKNTVNFYFVQWSLLELRSDHFSGSRKNTA